MEIQLRNLQSQPVPEDLLGQAAQEAGRLRPGAVEALTVVLTDDARIGELNAAFLGREGPTDVIAFEPEEEAAEVFVSVETAQRQAQERGHELGAELAFLVAHGVLHTAGMDDSTTAGREEMLQLQRQVIERLGLTLNQ